jgi:hypothetical protein
MIYASRCGGVGRETGILFWMLLGLIITLFLQTQAVTVPDRKRNLVSRAYLSRDTCLNDAAIVSQWVIRRRHAAHAGRVLCAWLRTALPFGMQIDPLTLAPSDSKSTDISGLVLLKACSDSAVYDSCRSPHAMGDAQIRWSPLPPSVLADWLIP